MIFDSHAHYDDEAFDGDRDELLSSMKENGIGYIVNIASSLDTIVSTIKLTEKFDFIYGTAGVHPSDISRLDEEKFRLVEDSLGEPKIIGVGETGLDYHYKDASAILQKKWFERHIELAKEKHLPLVVHSRDANKDTLDMMKALKAEEAGGVIHCFSYGVETAREYLNKGFYLGIGGVLTFKNARKLKEVVEYMPLEQILLETDCPYLSPEPNRGKRNSSLYLPFIIRETARIKKISEEEVIRVTCQNAMRMYNIKEQ
ncbi:TatD family hydrolase [Parasporobacterium paucivorans]|uniref:TatD DNase family protein n=1 Tax=Parasporobacterium paucivorans DSM 15970 TaxID=1122934 RepID=A0A1M6BBV7_9FIRM|nr:TatD family hydrolase [Parasporobacterium paucivorans]SHI46058.1 TatD DNase family protein [Parasporobacterium paucivorans DSM 15970]